MKIKLKTFLGAFSVMTLCSGLALAGWNINQGDRGETVFENEDGVRAPAGQNGILVTFTDLSFPWTRYVVAHRGGYVTKMYAVNEGPLTQSATPSIITLLQMFTDGNPSKWTAVNGLAVTITGDGTPGATKPGSVSSDETGTSTFKDADNASYFVTAGEVLAIRNDGGDDDVVDGSVIIIIE